MHLGRTTNAVPTRTSHTHLLPHTTRARSEKWPPEKGLLCHSFATTAHCAI